MRSLSRSRNALVLVAMLFALWGQAPAPVTSVHVNAKHTAASAPSVDCSVSTCYYIRDGGSATGTSCRQVSSVGAGDWTLANSCDQIPTPYVRGAYYLLADGTYTIATLNTAASGTTPITIKKASTTDHGTDTGWVSTLGDGQADLGGGFTVTTPYWVVDGSYRNESDWSDGTLYGFKMECSGCSQIMYTDPSGAGSSCGADNVTVKYVNAGGPETTSGSSGPQDDIVYMVCFNDPGSELLNWTLSHNRFHHERAGAMVQALGVNGPTIEYNYFGPHWGKEAIRGGNSHGTRNAVIRYNKFVNACGTDTLGNSCTGDIAIWAGTGSAGEFNGNEVYGNTFQVTNNDQRNGGFIIIGGDGAGWLGIAANNTLVCNNTFTGLASAGVSDILINGGSGNIARNNLAYNVIGTPSFTPNTANNSEVGSDPFVALASGNLHLAIAQAVSALTSCPSGNNLDMDGVTRGADGTIDQGAFEK